MKALCVVGARPNFIKAKPVIDGLTARGIDVALVHTGQHYDPALSDVFFDDLGIAGTRAPPRHRFGLASGASRPDHDGLRTIGGWIGSRCRDRRGRCELDGGLCAGRRESGATCSSCRSRAAKQGLGDAGDQSGRHGPVERPPVRAVGRDAVDNLRAEGNRKDQIHLVGNVMVDSLLANVERAKRRPRSASAFGLGNTEWSPCTGPPTSMTQRSSGRS